MIMTRLIAFEFLVAALGTGVAMPATAQETAKNEPAASPVLVSPRPRESPRQAPKRTRAVSSSVAAQLAAVMPKYEPPPPAKTQEPAPESELVDMREIDRPRNEIIRLPDYIVKEPAPPVFSERAISTDKGLADIAVRRYISEVDRALNRFTIPLFGISKEKRALAMYAEDERLQNMAALADAANTVSVSDAAAGDYVRKEARKTYLRSSQFGYGGSNSK